MQKKSSNGSSFHSGSCPFPIVQQVACFEVTSDCARDATGLSRFSTTCRDELKHNFPFLRSPIVATIDAASPKIQDNFSKITDVAALRRDSY